MTIPSSTGKQRRATFKVNKGNPSAESYLQGPFDSLHSINQDAAMAIIDSPGDSTDVRSWPLCLADVVDLSYLQM